MKVVKEIYIRFPDIINLTLSTTSSLLDKSTQIKRCRKLIKSLLKKWVAKFMKIEEAQDLKTLEMEDPVLLTYEIHLHKEQEETSTKEIGLKITINGPKIQGDLEYEEISG